MKFFFKKKYDYKRFFLITHKRNTSVDKDKKISEHMKSQATMTKCLSEKITYSYPPRRASLVTQW